jgi:hypothetical protein
VWIRSVESLTCGIYDGVVLRNFYIAPNGSVFLYPRDYYDIKSQTAKMQKVQGIPEELKYVLEKIKRNKFFTVNAWEFDQAKNEFIVYVHDIKDESAINDIVGEQLGKNSIRIVHDVEFESTRADVKRQLAVLRKNPEYQIAWIGTITDTTGDYPEKYIELWVYESTQENKKIDNSVIQGWTIHVYPVSR